MTIRNRSIIVSTEGAEQPNGDLVENFINYKKKSKSKIKPATERAYRAYLPSFMDTANADALIVAKDVQGLEDAALQWLDVPLGKKTVISDATWNRRCAYLKAFFAYLVKRKHLPENPLGDAEKRSEDKRFLSFGDEDVNRCSKKLYDIYIAKPTFLNLRNFLLFVFLSTTGVRAGEAGGFARRDIDPALEMIVIHGRITKTKQTRHVPIPLFTAEAWMKKKKGKSDYQILFEAFFNAHSTLYPDDTTPFFCNQSGGRLTANAIWQAIRPIMKACGLRDGRIHDLRHYALTRIAMNGGAMAVQEIAGHATPVMTARYINPTPQQVCRIGAAAIKKAAACATLQLTR
jgi:integrase